MGLKRYSVLKVKEGRETIYIEDIGYSKGSFRDCVRQYSNGLMNSHGGVMYFGVTKNGVVKGKAICRKEEDEYRLTVDHVFGSFQPFVSVKHYRLTFMPVDDAKYFIIELKVSIGEIGEIYEDGTVKVFVVDGGQLVGPLWPQELKELVLLKYKQSIEGAEEAAKYCTPYLARAKMVAKTTQKTNREMNNKRDKENQGARNKSPLPPAPVRTDTEKTISKTTQSSSTSVNKTEKTNGEMNKERGKENHGARNKSPIPPAPVTTDTEKISSKITQSSSTSVNKSVVSGGTGCATKKTVSSAVIAKRALPNKKKNNNNSRDTSVRSRPPPRVHSVASRTIASAATPRTSYNINRHQQTHWGGAAPLSYNHKMYQSTPFLNRYDASQPPPYGANQRYQAGVYGQMPQHNTYQTPPYNFMAYQQPLPQSAYHRMQQLISRGNFF